MALTFDGPSPEQPTAGDADLVLRGESADARVDDLRHAVAAARLNALFPPARRLLAHLGFLGPSGSGGLYPGLRVSRVSGLPSAYDVLRVNVDRGLALEFGAQLGPAHAKTPDTAAVARRLAYYQRLRQAAVMPLNRMEVDLRQQLPDQRRALFRVVLDRFDLRRGQFVRYTILLGQRHRFWRQRQMAVDDADLVETTEGFRRTVGLLSFHNAERAFLALADTAQIEVEDVHRCRVGPALTPGADVIAPLAELLDPDRGPCAGEPAPLVLCLPEDRASVELTADAGQDLPSSLRGRQVQPTPTAPRGFSVARTCKLTCPPPLVKPLRRLCRDLGAPSVVRPY